jgi:hypothetical protein
MECFGDGADAVACIGDMMMTDSATGRMKRPADMQLRSYVTFFVGEELSGTGEGSMLSNEVVCSMSSHSFCGCSTM